MKKIKKIRSRFLKVECNTCKNEQVVFGCITTPVKCLNCGKLLFVPTGGKAELVKEKDPKTGMSLCNARIIDVLDKNLG